MMKSEKKYLLLFLFIIILLFSTVKVYAYYDDSINSYIKNAELYEKTIEDNINGKLEWEPIGVSDSEPINVDVRLGKSTSKNSSFRYFYDSDKEYLIQYFTVNKKQGVVIWDGGEIISYEIFS